MKVYVAAIETQHGTNLYADRTQAGLDAQLTDYCRECWKGGGPDGPAPETDAAVISAYFDYHAEGGGSESYADEAVDLPDDGSPSAVTYSLSEMETALCVWEEMLRVKNTEDADNAKAMLRTWEGRGSSVMRFTAIDIGKWIAALFVAEAESPIQVLCDAYSFDWDVVPAIMSFIEWSADTPQIWIRPEGTPAELAARVSAALEKARETS